MVEILVFILMIRITGIIRILRWCQLSVTRIWQPWWLMNQG